MVERIRGDVRVPDDGRLGGRASRRRARSASDSLVGDQQSPEPRAAGFPDYLPDPLAVGGRDYLIVRDAPEAFAQKLLARMPGAVAIPFDVPAGSVIFPRVPSRGFAGRLQTHCKRGHVLGGGHSYTRRADGARICKLCVKTRRREKNSKGPARG